MTAFAAATLSAKHRRFVDEYRKDFNGAAAYVRAGYSKRRARAGAAELLARPDIQAALAEGQARTAERAEIEIDEVVAFFASVVRGQVDESKVRDRLTAADKLMLHLGGYKPDQHEHTGKDGGPIRVETTDRDRAKAIAALIAKAKATRE